jgi:hypothetical protein
MADSDDMPSRESTLVVEGTSGFDNILAKRQAVEEVFLEESRKITRRRYVAAAAVTGLGVAAFFFFFFPL